MKRKLNLFCACVLIGIFLSTSMVVSIVIQSAISGYEAAHESALKGKKMEIPNYKMICTLPSNPLVKTGSITNAKDMSQVSIKPIISLVEVPKGGSNIAQTATTIFTLILFVVGIFCLIQFFKLIRNINRGDIFSWKNVKFLRKLGWSLILLFICTFSTIMIGNYEAAQVLTLEGCEYSNTFAFSDPSFILGFIALLVAEVFAVGLKLKEEQDLTI